MGTPRLFTQVIGADTFGASIRKLAEQVKDWRPFWRDVFLPRYIGQIQQNFETEGELVGGWPDLDPTYAAWKARHFPGRKILERTRRLRSSLAHGATGPDTVIQARPLELRFGTRVPYAKWARIYNREPFPPIKKGEWAPIVKAYFKERARQAGFKNVS